MQKPKNTLNFKGYEIAFKLSNYCDNGVLAIVVYEYTSYGCAYQYGVASVNINDMIFGVNQTYIDENNNPGMTQFLVDNGLVTPTGYIGRSGYCQYPLVEVNIEEILKYCIIDDEDAEEAEEAENQAECPDEEDDNVQSFWDFLKECEDSCDDIDVTEEVLESYKKEGED
jgi:hypothetical protein